MEHQAIDRRQFLKTVGSGIAASVLLSPFSQAQLTQSQVIQASSEQVWLDGALQTEIVRQMLDTTLMQLTGQKDIAEAWKQLVAPEDIVGIKISTEADPRLSSHHEIVDGIIQGLQSAGHPDSQILIWDRHEGDLINAGYAIQMDKSGVRCYATDQSGPGYDSRVFYDSAEDLASRRENDDTRSLFSKIVTQDITRIINVGVLKQHVSCGVSLTLKNLAFGSVNNTARFYGKPVDGDPAIAEICNHVVLKQKPVLHLLDGLVGCFDKGPGFTEQGTWPAGILLASLDPVALDQTGFELISERRKAAKLPSLLSQASHIKTAARLRLGTNTPDEINIREVEV